MNKKQVIPVIYSVLLSIIMLATGCYPGENPSGEQPAEGMAVGTRQEMGDRIRFHDQLWAQQAISTQKEQVVSGESETDMARRIQFHDQLWGTGEPGSEKTMSMADRIRFHDRLWAQRQ